MEATNGRYAGYARVSTDSQAMSPMAQEQRIMAWFNYQKASGQIPSDAQFLGMFLDEAVSSKVAMLERPAGYNLMTALLPGDTIVCASLSRAFRSASDAETTMQRLQEANIRMVFLDLQVDTSTSSGRMFLGILAVMARFERDLVSERTREVLHAMKMAGKVYSRPPIGWRIKNAVDKTYVTKSYIAYKEERVIAEAARRMYRRGFTLELTAKIIRRQQRKNPALKSLSQSKNWLVKAAAVACLGYPKHAIKTINDALEMDIRTVQFILRDDHAELARLLKERLIAKGYTHA